MKQDIDIMVTNESDERKRMMIRFEQDRIFIWNIHGQSSIFAAGSKLPTVWDRSSSVTEASLDGLPLRCSPLFLSSSSSSLGHPSDILDSSLYSSSLDSSSWSSSIFVPFLPTGSPEPLLESPFRLCRFLWARDVPFPEEVWGWAEDGAEELDAGQEDEDGEVNEDDPWPELLPGWWWWYLELDPSPELDRSRWPIASSDANRRT